MYYKEVVDCVVVSLDFKKFGLKESYILNRVLKNKSYDRVGIDMSSITSLKNDFLDFIRRNFTKSKVSFFNVSPEVYMFLSMLKYDKYVNVYANQIDFLEKKRSILNRKFNVYQ